MSLLALIIWILVLGLGAFLIHKAPVVDEPFKSIAVYILLVIAVALLVVFLLTLSGVPTPILLR